MAATACYPDPPITPSPSPPQTYPTNDRPIFMATHPRACSTAFERVMMTRKELNCVHEPFGEPFYYSNTERMGKRFNGDGMKETREKSGHAESTFGSVWGGIEKEKASKRVFIKDIAHYLIAPSSYEGEMSLSPSLQLIANLTKPQTKSSLPNPTVVPLPLLRSFQWTFLIRSPLRSIPSYYRCTQPPLSNMTGFTYFMPEEAGYRELRMLFDYLRSEGIVNDSNLFVLDADDLLENPEEAIRRYCDVVDIEYKKEMLSWGDNDGCEKFEKWKGFHEDAIGSSGLKRREKKERKGLEEEYIGWVQKWGKEAAEVIKATCLECWEDYEHLKGFKENF